MKKLLVGLFLLSSSNVFADNFISEVREIAEFNNAYYSHYETLNPIEQWETRHVFYYVQKNKASVNENCAVEYQEFKSANAIYIQTSNTAINGIGNAEEMQLHSDNDLLLARENNTATFKSYFACATEDYNKSK